MARSRRRASALVKNVSEYTNVTGNRDRVYFAPVPAAC